MELELLKKKNCETVKNTVHFTNGNHKIEKQHDIF